MLKDYISTISWIVTNNFFLLYHGLIIFLKKGLLEILWIDGCYGSGIKIYIIILKSQGMVNDYPLEKIMPF